MCVSHFVRALLGLLGLLSLLVVLVDQPVPEGGLVKMFVNWTLHWNNFQKENSSIKCLKDICPTLSPLSPALPGSPGSPWWKASLKQTKKDICSDIYRLIFINKHTFVTMRVDAGRCWNLKNKNEIQYSQVCLRHPSLLSLPVKHK